MRIALAAGLIAVGLAAPASGDEKPLWLVVTTPALAPSIQPLADRRRSEGFDVAVVEGDPQAALAHNKRPAYLLLVGDAPGPDESPDPAWHIPPVELPLYRWREVQRKTFASDAKWGELDGDLLPDVPVGRIPARTPEEAAAVVTKILAYEDRPWKLDDLCFPMWQGSPNYGPAIDAAASMLMLPMLDASVPRWGEPSLIAALPGSPFCGWPPEHAATFDRWLRRGGMFALVGCHGNDDSFFSMAFRDQWSGYQIADVERDLADGPASCPLVILSCSTGNFISPQRCLTEALLLAPGGPVAVAGATTESHPLTNALHGLAMSRGLTAEPGRLGDWWLDGLRGVHRQRNLMLESMLRNVEGSFYPQIDVSQLRRDQAWMYALLGDPATRLRVPGKLTATIEPRGEKWHWRVEPPPSAKKLEVAFRPQRPKVMPAAPANLTEQSAAAVQDQANAMLAYKPTASLAASEPWQGEVAEPGEVRLVAFAPDSWYVAVLQVSAK